MPTTSFRLLDRLSYVVVFLGFLTFQPAHAMSCMAMTETYYFSCEASRCSPLFKATPIPTPAGGCSRRNKISEIDPVFASYLARVAAEADPSIQRGIYAMSFHFRSWQYEPSPTFEKWSVNLAELTGLPTPTLASPEIPVSELVRWMRQNSRAELVKLEAAQTDASSADRLRRHIEEESENEWFRGAKVVATGWAFALVFLGSLVLLTYLFYRRLVAGEVRVKATRLGLLLLCQFAIVGAIFCAITFSGHVFALVMMYPQPIVVMPVPLLIWLLEGYWLFRYRAKWIGRQH